MGQELGHTQAGIQGDGGKLVLYRHIEGLAKVIFRFMIPVIAVGNHHLTQIAQRGCNQRRFRLGLLQGQALPLKFFGFVELASIICQTS